MKDREQQAAMAFLLPVVIFFIALAAVVLLVRPAKGDELSDLISRLEAKAAAKADPFAHGNHAQPPPKSTCPCTDLGDCVCPVGSCGCPDCGRAPRVGDRKVTDDTSRPWTYGYGREYGYNELGWYRPTLQAYQPAYQYPEQGRRFFVGGARSCGPDG